MHTELRDITSYYEGPNLSELPVDLRDKVRDAAQVLANGRWTGKLCVTDLRGDWLAAAHGYRAYAIFDNGLANDMYFQTENGGTFLVKFADGGDTDVRLTAQQKLGVGEPSGLTGRPGDNEWVVVQSSLGPVSAFSPTRTGPAIGIRAKEAA